MPESCSKICLDCHAEWPESRWIPAFAGMTGLSRARQRQTNIVSSEPNAHANLRFQGNTGFRHTGERRYPVAFNRLLNWLLRCPVLFRRAYWMGWCTIALLLSACAPAPQQADIRMALSQAPINLDPRYATDAASERVNRLIYRPLVDFDAHFKPIFDLWVNKLHKRVSFRFMSQNMHSRSKYVS